MTIKKPLAYLFGKDREEFKEYEDSPCWWCRYAYCEIHPLSSENILTCEHPNLEPTSIQSCNLQEIHPIYKNELDGDDFYLEQGGDLDSSFNDTSNISHYKYNLNPCYKVNPAMLRIARLNAGLTIQEAETILKQYKYNGGSEEHPIAKWEEGNTESLEFATACTLASIYDIHLKVFFMDDYSMETFYMETIEDIIYRLSKEFFEPIIRGSHKQEDGSWKISAEMMQSLQRLKELSYTALDAKSKEKYVQIARTYFQFLL